MWEDMVIKRDRLPLRVGIIGTGKHGSRYAGHVVHDIETMTLRAISRRSEVGKEQAGKWQCAYYKDWRKLIEDEQIDCVVAAVPPTLNLEIATLCAHHNKPVLIEKPLAGSLADAQKIVELATQKGLTLTVGQTLRYNSVIQKLKEQLSQIGMLHTFSANQRLEPTTQAWHEDPEQAGAGVSFHTAVHVFDALSYITGLKVKRVAAITRNCRHHPLEDIFTALVELENGVVGTVDCSKIGNARSGRFEFVGEACQLHGEQIYNKCFVLHGQERTDFTLDKAVNTIVPLLRQWGSYLLGEGENPVSGQEGLQSVMACEASLQAARENRWVNL